MLMEEMREGGESKISMRFLRGFRFSFQLFYERGGIFKVHGMFVGD